MRAEAAGHQILHTKLYPPRLPAIVARGRLHHELAQAKSAKLAVIVAGAGYGKSTLAAEFLHRLGCPFMWYRLETTDSDLSVFLSYVVEGLRGTYPEFGERTVAHIASAASVTEQGTAILSTLVAELDALNGEELFIVLDDFETVSDSPPIIGAMDFLLDHTMSGIHFIVASRSLLPMELARLRARRELLELSESQLGFDLQETATLFAEVFDEPLATEDLESISEYTEGWVTGLVLFHLALKAGDGDRLSAAIKDTGFTPAVMAEYLSRVVYEGQSDEVRDFLTRTSVLSRMNPRFCDELLGINNSRVILSRLLDERLFTIPMDDVGDWYRYHHCLSAFLRQTLQWHCSPEEVEDLHLQAAALWERNGEQEQALSHYMDAECYENAADILESIGEELMRANRISFFSREISRLPEDVLQMRPGLMLRAGETAAMAGDWKRVFTAAYGAVHGFEKAGERDSQTMSLLGSAAALVFTGELENAARMVSEAKASMLKNSPLWCEVLAIESTIACDAGRADDAERLVRKSLRLSGRLEDTQRRVVPIAWCGLTLALQGRFSEATEAFISADGLTGRTGLTHAHAFLYAILSRTYAALDRLEEAKRMSDRAIDLGEKHSLKSMLFLNHAARAVTLAYLGERESALADLSVAAEMFGEAEAMGEAMWMEWLLAEACLLLGIHSEALEHMRRFEKMVAGYDGCRHIARVGVISCQVEELGLKRAAKEAVKVLESARSGGPRMALSLAYSLLFRLEVAGGRLDEAIRILEAYIEEFGTDVVLRWQTTDTGYFLPVFTELFSRGRQLDFMDRVFRLAGSKSVPFLRKLGKSNDAGVAERARRLLESISREAVKPLVIRMLGPFEVGRDGQVLFPANWKSGRALSIFKYLALNRDRGFVPRDVLMELCWPDIPAESAQKNLNTALTSLRKTLEPEAQRGESSYLVKSGDTLRLELGAGGWTDLELFREKLWQAGEAKRRGDFACLFRTLLEAADIYRGELFAEDPYGDWCGHEREALKNAYVGLVEDIATEHLRRGEARQALERLENAVARDPAREELYRKQMAVCGQVGDRAGVEKAYRRCEKHLNEAYDVSPSSETRELYERLRGQ